MEENKELIQVLNRIADSLEKIANNCNCSNKNIVHLKNTLTNNKLEINLDKDKENLNSNNWVNNKNEIEAFLLQRGIKIKTIKSEDDSDEILDKISLFMGNRYSLIKKIYEPIKSVLNKGRRVELNLKNSTQDEISSICQLCTNLYQIAFLEQYKYSKSPNYQLYAKPSSEPNVINFFTGQWLERFIKTQVINSITSKLMTQDYSYLINPQIILPNGDDFELDILFRIKNEFFWFEAKTGEYQRYIGKYSKMSEILKLDTNHAFMILTDITENGAGTLKSLFKMNVVKIDLFEDIFTKSIEKLTEINEAYIDDNVE